MIVNNIVVNSAQNESGVFAGFNAQNSWSSHSKQTANFSTPGGIGNLFLANQNLTTDNDLLDLQGYDGDFNPGV